MRSRLTPADLVRAGSIGLRTRRVRTALSALGIAIGIAAMVAVVGISSSSRADLLAQLDALGTNLLRIAPGQSFIGETSTLPTDSASMVGRIAGVESTSALSTVSGSVRRTDRIPESETGGLAVVAADIDLDETLGLSMHRGRFLDEASGRLPAVVLGSKAAERLGIDRLGVQVWLADRWFTVAGILRPAALAEDVDRSALIGLPVAASELDHDGDLTTVYVRTAPGSVDAVRRVLAATANPEAPEEVRVSRPSDALAARAAADNAFTSLLLGLGAVALLVGGVGIANVMVISVLERRSEIGLRRALGASRRHVALQFLAESLLLALLGGLGGVALGSAVTGGYASTRSWTVSLPPGVLLAGVGAAAAIGAVAGLYPAGRAARLAPTEALRSV